MGHYNNLNGEWWLYSVHCECAVYKLEIQESVEGEIDGWWERVLLKRAGAKPSEPETPDAGSGLVLMMLMRKKWEIMTFVMTMLTMMFTRMISMVSFSRFKSEADVARLDPVRPPRRSRDGLPLLQKGEKLQPLF